MPEATTAGPLASSTRSSSTGTTASTTATGDQAIDYEVTIRLLNPPKDTKPDFSATAKAARFTAAQAVEAR